MCLTTYQEIVVLLFFHSVAQYSCSLLMYSSLAPPSATRLAPLFGFITYEFTDQKKRPEKGGNDPDLFHHCMKAILGCRDGAWVASEASQSERS